MFIFSFYGIVRMQTNMIYLLLLQEDNNQTDS
jgi:hypothetical protein